MNNDVMAAARWMSLHGRQKGLDEEESTTPSDLRLLLYTRG